MLAYELLEMRVQGAMTCDISYVVLYLLFQKYSIFYAMYFYVI